MPESTDNARSPVVPPLPSAVSNPLSVVVAGMSLWAVVALIYGVIRVVSGEWPGGANVVWWGLAVGVIGTSIFLNQLRSARRGDKTAQQGLVP